MSCLQASEPMISPVLWPYWSTSPLQNEGPAMSPKLPSGSSSSSTGHCRHHSQLSGQSLSAMGRRAASWAQQEGMKGSFPGLSNSCVLCSRVAVHRQHGWPVLRLSSLYSLQMYDFTCFWEAGSIALHGGDCVMSASLSRPGPCHQLPDGCVAISASTPAAWCCRCANAASLLRRCAHDGALQERHVYVSQFLQG